MPGPLAPVWRQRVFALWQKGMAAAVIAQRLHLVPRTVRRLGQAFVQRGAAALPPAHPRRPPPEPTIAIQQALLLHTLHPTWGAPYVLIQLRHGYPELAELPSSRTLQRWFRRTQQPAAPAGRKPSTAQDHARQPHAVWQMDAVEQLRLATGQLVSWLRWVDEYTGAVLGTVVFPPRQLRRSAAVRRAAGAAAALAPLGLAANAPG